jgi:hypothetical protein
VDLRKLVKAFAPKLVWSTACIHALPGGPLDALRIVFRTLA